MLKETKTLIGVELDYTVAICENRKDFGEDNNHCCIEYDYSYIRTRFGIYEPSKQWEHGGPIISRERISIKPYSIMMAGWFASVGKGFYQGDTPLIAAMRCYVASKLGKKVEIPNNFIKNK